MGPTSTPTAAKLYVLTWSLCKVDSSLSTIQPPTIMTKAGTVMPVLHQQVRSKQLLRLWCLHLQRRQLCCRLWKPSTKPLMICIVIMKKSSPEHITTVSECCNKLMIIKVVWYNWRRTAVEVAINIGMLSNGVLIPTSAFNGKTQARYIVQIIRLRNLMFWWGQ